MCVKVCADEKSSREHYFFELHPGDQGVVIVNPSSSLSCFVETETSTMFLFTLVVSEMCDVPGLPFEPDPGFLEMEVIAGFRVWQLAFMGATAIVVIIIVLCCFFRCRIPRTKQEIEADVARKKVTKKFRQHLEKLPVDKMELVQVLPEVIELETKRLKKGEIEQKKTLFQKFKSMFAQEDDDDDDVSKTTVSIEDSSEKRRNSQLDDDDEEVENEEEKESDESSDYDENGEKITQTKKKRKKRGIGLADDDDTSSEESKRMKKLYLSLSYQPSSIAEMSTFKQEKKTICDSVNVTIEDEEEDESATKSCSGEDEEEDMSEEDETLDEEDESDDEDENCCEGEDEEDEEESDEELSEVRTKL